MKKFKYLLHFIPAITLVFLVVLLSCNPRVNEEESKTDTSGNSAKLEEIKSIPDSVIQFLIHSAAKDFNEHQPPTVTDIRNVKAGYISSAKETIYLICGELLSQQEKNWVQFVTIKTSGYEQYIGDNVYCQKATFEKTEKDRLSDEIKTKLKALSK